MSKKILVLLGHPDKATLCGSLAESYQSGAQEAGHEVRRVNLGDLYFDPILHKGYKEIQQLEPDLIDVQEHFKWADHIVVVYPAWWSDMPAILKGFFDRTFLPNFAFSFDKKHPYRWKKLLKHKTGRLIITMDNLPLSARFLFGAPGRDIRKGIFWFSGISPTKTTLLGPAKNLPPAIALRWQARVKALGRSAR